MIGNGLRTCVSDEDLAKNVGDALEGVARPRNPWLAQLLPTYHERRRRHIGQLHDDGSETGGVLPGCYGWSLFCMWCCLLKVSNFQERASSIRVKNSPDELHVRSDVGFESLCSSVAWKICGRKSSIAGNTCSPSSGRVDRSQSTTRFAVSDSSLGYRRTLGDSCFETKRYQILGNLPRLTSCQWLLQILT